MSSIFRRTKPASAQQIARLFLEKHNHEEPRRVSQYLDAPAFSRFAAAIPRHIGATSDYGTTTPLRRNAQSGIEASVGEALPPCWHLGYFTPSQPNSELGADGTDTSYNPTEPFTRRMWAGGVLEWKTKTRGLEIGASISERTTVRSADAKKTKAGEEMIVVGVRKEFLDEKDECHLVDDRNWVFRPAIEEPLKMVTPPKPQNFPNAKFTRDFVQDAVTLFRFSAVTYNAHKIHYSLPWCQEVEGHRGLVVHGPLNLLLITEMWRDMINQGRSATNPKRLEYRATGPLYADEPYRICMEEEKDRIVEAKIVDSYGNTSMKAKIESWEV